MFFLINFNKFEKTLRRKKLIYFLLLYYKNFKIFKFNNIKRKINNFNYEFFFIIITILISISRCYLKYKKIKYL